jgi:hypothetical protein
MKKLDRVLAVISVAVISVAFYIADAPTLLAQNVVAQDEKAGAAGKVNLDNDGVILLGSDVVAYFKEDIPVLGVPAFTTTYHAPHTFSLRLRIKRSLTKTQRNTFRSMAHFVPTA